MIEKLNEYTSCYKILGSYREIKHPTFDELTNKINEIIDYLNNNEQTCAELIAEHEKKPVELIVDNISKHQSDFSDME